MVNAAAIAQLSAMAPGRLVVGIGSGFTGRVTLGQRPLKWSYVTDYTRCLLALLKGGSHEWEGARIKMMHPAGFAPARPIKVPLVFGTAGPKGNAAAREMADGIITTAVAIPPAGSSAWTALLTLGTVLGDNEAPASERVVDAAGHGVSVALHGMYERKRDMSRIPGAAQWVAGIEALPKPERHIALRRPPLDRRQCARPAVDDGRAAAPVRRRAHQGRVAHLARRDRAQGRQRDLLSAGRPRHRGRAQPFRRGGWARRMITKIQELHAPRNFAKAASTSSLLATSPRAT